MRALEARARKVLARMPNPKLWDLRLALVARHGFTPPVLEAAGKPLLVTCEQMAGDLRAEISQE